MNGEVDEESSLVDINETAIFLNLSKAKVRKLIERNILRNNWGQYTNLIRFTKKVSHIEEGSVLNYSDANLEIIRGFPKIRRCLLLEPALKKNFSSVDEVAVEEKMNGYNVRAAQINGDIIAFTRGGLVCPYTTEKVNELIDPTFFEDYPNLILCAEMVGPDNPYVAKTCYDVNSLDFFVFDIREKNSGEPYPVKKRRETLEAYKIKQVNLFGYFKPKDAHKEITKIINEIGSEEREGVVVKDPEMILQPMKYTTSNSNCKDLEFGFKFYNDIGRDYLFSRVIREGFQAAEWNENNQKLKDRCYRVGSSILYPMVNTINSVGKNKKVTEDAQIKVTRLEVLDLFKQHLNRSGIEVLFEEPIPEEDGYIVKMKKLNKSTNDKTESIWLGDYW